MKVKDLSSKPFGRYWATILFLLAGLGLIAENIRLHHVIGRRMAAEEARAVQIGSELSKVSCLNLDGRYTEIQTGSDEAPGRRTLLITVALGCPACSQRQAGWNRIAAGLRATGSWRIIWITRGSVESGRKYAEANKIPLNEVFAEPSYLTYRTLAMDLVPQVVVVDASGRVTFSRLGLQDWSEADLK
jgi:hypothetical protein